MLQAQDLNIRIENSLFVLSCDVEKLLAKWEENKRI
jgi:hypothetical protein